MELTWDDVRDGQRAILVPLEAVAVPAYLLLNLVPPRRRIVSWLDVLTIRPENTGAGI